MCEIQRGQICTPASLAASSPFFLGRPLFGGFGSATSTILTGSGRGGTTISGTWVDTRRSALGGNCAGVVAGPDGRPKPAGEKPGSTPSPDGPFMT